VIRVLCVGTATEVGKTWVGAAVLAELRARGLDVVARKPVQSFDPNEPGPTDADVLAAATGEHADDVCPGHRWYPLAMAPPIAASLLEREGYLIADLADELMWGDHDVVWIETVGGPRSPIADDGDSADLARWVLPDLIVLVADAGLGTINAVVLSMAPFLQLGIEPIVLLNRYDPDDDLHRRNREWLSDWCDISVLVTSAEMLAAALLWADELPD
jgi:dethiobiotin synthetase